MVFKNLGCNLLFPLQNRVDFRDGCPSRSREVILQDLARILQDSFKEDASL